MATSFEELTHWKRLWYWVGLGAGGEGDDRGWDGWMASPTQWTWICVNSRSWWWTGRPGVLQFMGSQRVRHGWATELNWCFYQGHFSTRVLLKSIMFYQKLCSQEIELEGEMSDKNFFFFFLSRRVKWSDWDQYWSWPEYSAWYFPSVVKVIKKEMKGNQVTNTETNLKN